MRKTRTSKIALGGIYLALTVIFIFAASIVPGVELTLFALSSVFTAVMLIETGVGGSLLLYVAAVILGFFIMPNKLAIVPYTFFFGYYGIIKYFIEKIKNAPLQITIKVCFFAVLLCVALMGFKEVLLGRINLPDYHISILIIGGIIMLLLYDYIYTLIINFYMRRIKRKGADNIKLS